MTGNVVLLGFAFAGVESLSVSRSVTALAAFLLGAVLGSRLARSTDLSRRRWPTAAFASEAALLLMSAGLARAVLPDTDSVGIYVVIALTGLAMGLRNAPTSRDSPNPRRLGFFTRYSRPHHLRCAR